MSYINGKRLLKTMRVVSLNLDDVYPVGAIYMSVNSTSPETLFGGTWEQIKDVFLLGAGDTYSNGTTGGEATHILSVNEMPSHNHIPLYAKRDNGTEQKWSVTPEFINTANGSQVEVDNISSSDNGGGQAHNNMPPYLAVYIWKRTA